MLRSQSGNGGGGEESSMSRCTNDYVEGIRERYRDQEKDIEVKSMSSNESECASDHTEKLSFTKEDDQED